MALLGYARVSTSHQKLTHQIMELKSAGIREDRIFTDMMTGQRISARGYSACWSVQRKMASSSVQKWVALDVTRNTADMIRVVDGCYKKEIAIRFMENGVSTEGTMWKMVIQILAAEAEAERERILERTNDGRIVALAAGVKFGRKIHPRTPAALDFIL